MAKEDILNLTNIAYSYGDNVVLKNVNIKLFKGELVSLFGPSGSGKSTLLNIVGMLNNPTSGLLELCGRDVSKCKTSELTKIRAKNIGFVYQFHHLLPNFTGLENVIIPQLPFNIGKIEAKENATMLMSELRVEHVANRLPSAMSGGERQRVAIARALVNRPKVIVADEPTGALDSENSRNVFELIRKYVKEHGVTALIATHDEGMTSFSDRTIRLFDGEIRKPLIV